MTDRRLSGMLANGHYYFAEGGHFISEKQRRINEILKDYDPELELQWIPPADRSASDVAFRVLHRPSGRPPYVVLTAQEADERLLARVFEADQRTASQRHGGQGNLLTFLDNYNNAIELVNAKAHQEKLDEAHEIAVSAIRNNKSHFFHKVNGRMVDFESR